MKGTYGDKEKKKDKKKKAQELAANPAKKPAAVSKASVVTVSKEEVDQMSHSSSVCPVCGLQVLAVPVLAPAVQVRRQHYSGFQAALTDRLDLIMVVSGCVQQCSVPY